MLNPAARVLEMVIHANVQISLTIRTEERSQEKMSMNFCNTQYELRQSYILCG